MDVSATNIALSGLAKQIVIDDFLDEQTVITALTKAKDEQVPFVHYLIQNKLMTRLALAHAMSHNFGIPLFDLKAFDNHHIPHNLIKESIIRKHHVLPLYKHNKNLYVAICDPAQQIALDEIKFYTGLQTYSVLVEELPLNKLIEEVLSEQEAAIPAEFDDSHLKSSNIDYDIVQEATESLTPTAEDAPIIRFVHKVLLNAMNKNASDIHFEPYEKHYRIRMRIDGILYEVASPELSLANPIATRIKVMSKLDISERRIPQDGRFKLNISSDHCIDFRVSTCPTIVGEKVVVRILDPNRAKIDIDTLGFNPKQKELFLKKIAEPQGMILVTGPTGSGKTVTLYTALNILNTPQHNIVTVEDPVEIHVSGINQVTINPKAGLTFAQILRAFLRQDPDIIMVGEMRDLETTTIAVKAAQTGHLVLSTLHTNNATESITRLLNMGLPTYNIATSITLIIAQRLARKLCPYCKKTADIPKEILLNAGFKTNELDTLILYKADSKGCDYCISGYKGRIGIFEMLDVSKEMSNAILTGKNALELAKIAKANDMTSLWISGLHQVKQGITSLEEISRISKD